MRSLRPRQRLTNGHKDPLKLLSSKRRLVPGASDACAVGKDLIAHQCSLSILTYLCTQASRGIFYSRKSPDQLLTNGGRDGQRICEKAK